jgi:ubiquinone/menaquinone biosynthesis C-methylase UbiE
MTTPTPDVEHWSSFKVWLFSVFARNPKSNITAVDSIAPGPDDHFLDLGCGLGAALERASATGARVAGVDPSPAMVRRAVKRVPHAEVKPGSAEEIPFPDDTFTVVASISSYHHWTDPDAGLKETLRVCAPGGRLYIVERRLKRNSGHGLSDRGATDLSEKLLELGHASSSVDPLAVGQSRYLVVTGAAPQ